MISHGQCACTPYCCFPFMSVTEVRRIFPQVDASTIAIGCWRGRTNISVMVTAIDCQEMLERLSVRMENGNGPVLLETEPSIVEREEPNPNDGETKDDAETMELATVG